MKIAIVMPCKWMHFSPKQATSSELTVHDILVHLPAGDDATVYAQAVDFPYSDVSIRFFPRGKKSDDRLLPLRVASDMRVTPPDMIVVEQHLPTAVRLRQYLPTVPILLHRHNDYDPPHRNFLRRWIQSRRFKGVDGIAFVSEHSRQKFLKSWGAFVSCRTFVVPNGMDLAIWNPVGLPDRKNEIVFVGRAIPEKGGLELAQSLVKILPQFPDFSARFIFGAPDTNPEYRETIQNLLAPFQGQVRIDYQISWAEIRAAFETTAIAVVPSICNEAFGRTALEAMVGSAALISSIRGGLDEVVGDAAYRLSDVTPDTIAAALADLIEHPEKRAELSVKGQKQAQKYTIEAQVQAFLAACHAVIKEKEGK